MKKLHLIVLSLLAVSLITHCPANSSGNQPPVDNTMQPPVDNTMQPPVDNTMQPPVDNTLPPPTDITTAKTIHAHVNEGVADDETVVDLSSSITVAKPTYSILEGNDDNIFSINSSTGAITVAKASEITYDATTKTNNIYMLKVRARNGSDTTKATEAPLRIVVRGFGGAFITTWKTTADGQSITIPTEGDGYSYTVDWGDGGEADPMNPYTGNATHTYATAGTYTVMITGDFPRIFINDISGPTGIRHRIQSVEQWGSGAWTSMEDAFHGTSILIVTAVDAPDLSKVTSMESMFQNATAFNQDINHWDTSNIQNMSFLFAGAHAFNQPIGEWDTSSVTDMENMFTGAAPGAHAFNQPIGNWNTAKVTDMSDMFRDAGRFNQDIGSWNTAMVRCMDDMFNSAFRFNQDISNWNTAEVRDMGGMFNSASAFNQDISNWNTARVTDMNRMFRRASVFNQNIAFNLDTGAWNTAMVTDMGNMFDGAAIFNQDISNWNVCNVTSRSGFSSSSALVPSNRPDFTNTDDCP